MADKDYHVLPDGSAFGVLTLPLPKDHWLTQPGDNDPPMSFRIGTEEKAKHFKLPRTEMEYHIRKAAKYAIRASTMNGQEIDFDPDAMVNNFVIGLIGFFTPDGTNGE